MSPSAKPEENLVGRSTPPASPQLQSLHRKEISLDDYLDNCVEAAVDDLKVLLSNEQLEIVRDTVREELTGNPVLMEMVRRVAGITPAPPADS